MHTPTAIRRVAPDRAAVDAARLRAGLRRQRAMLLVPFALLGVVVAWGAWALAPAEVSSMCVPLADDCWWPSLDLAFTARLAFCAGIVAACGALAVVLRGRRALADDALALGVDRSALRCSGGTPEPFYLQMRDMPC